MGCHSIIPLVNIRPGDSAEPCRGSCWVGAGGAGVQAPDSPAQGPAGSSSDLPPARCSWTKGCNRFAETQKKRRNVVLFFFGIKFQSIELLLLIACLFSK